VATPEIVDFAQLHDISEMWGSGAIATGTYVSATITLDYTNAAVSVMVNGEPTNARLVDYVTGGTPANYAITVNFDPLHQPTITPTYASTSALRFAIDFDLAASGRVSLGSPPVVYVRPFVTASLLPADTKLIRVRGPMINSSTDVSTYSVYVRPFYDEANNIGSVSLFSQPSTVYTVNGKTYVGAAGLAAMGVLSAGTTMTAGFTTFQTDYNPANGAYAGKFNLVYVIGASSLEDQYTEGLSGDVIARTGNTVTLLGSTLFLNTADTYVYCAVGEVAGGCNGNTQLLLGPGTIVTADDNTTLTGLNSESIAVGQHVSARGIYSLAADGSVLLDATGTSSTNTGSVRLQATELYGPLVSSAAGSLVMNVQNINNWPISDYHFDGNGATPPSPAAFLVETGGIGLPAGTAAGDSLWVDGFVTRFGSAPPDFNAVAVNNELTVSLAGGPVGGGASTALGTQTCGIGSQLCQPASLQVLWTSPPGTLTPFEVSSTSGFSINLGNTDLYSAVIRIGPESIDLTSLPASPQVVPTTLTATSTFSPQYTYGNPATFTSTSSVTSSSAIATFGDFTSFINGLNGAMNAANPARQLEARGVYDRATNIFRATSINFVL
jgi:hypothetical protein